MRRIILFIASSLDGYIAAADGSVDWLFTDQDYGYTPFSAGVDTLLMGRKTYNQSLSFGEYPFDGKEVFVFSRSRAGERDEHAAFVAGDLPKFVRGLRKHPGKDIWLVGGAEIVHEFLRHDLIDEHIVSVHPILLGGGVPLYPPPFPVRSLALRSVESFDTGLVQMTFDRVKTR